MGDGGDDYALRAGERTVAASSSSSVSEWMSEYVTRTLLVPRTASFNSSSSFLIIHSVLPSFRLRNAALLETSRSSRL